MKILHILSQFQVTGAEVFAATLANAQVKAGHQVFIMSDTWSTTTTATYIRQAIGVRSYAQRFRNIKAIRAFVKDHDIDVVHAHSRASSWVAYFALKGLSVPLLSQVHGRQHLHASSKSFDMYGDRVLAVCDNLRTHLTQELSIDRTKVFITPNGFDWRKILHLDQPDDYTPYGGKTIVLAGRTTGPKGEYTGQFIKQVVVNMLQLVPNKWRLVIIGGPLTDMALEVQQLWQALTEKYPERFIWLGFSTQLPNWLKAADLVIGSGRVALEALGLGRQVLAIGEWCTHGLVTDRNIEQASASNFGDIGAKMPHPGIDWSWVQQAAIEAITVASPMVLSERNLLTLKNQYDIDHVTTQIEEHYLSARAKKLAPRNIPILMYHKVPLKPLESKHRIFVTVDTFKAHLDYIKAQKLTPMTFREYDEWKRGLRPKDWLPKKPIILTFDDAYLDNYTNAWPLLKQYGYKAVIFALGDASIDHNFWDVANGEPSEPLMSLEQKKEMLQGGIEFGAHTMTHADLTKQERHKVIFEIAQSKSQLEDDLGVEVISFAYPYGRTSKEIAYEVKKAGFKYAVVINEHAAMHLEDNPFNIFRAYIFPEDIGGRIAKKASWWYRRYFKWKRGH